MRIAFLCFKRKELSPRRWLRCLWRFAVVVVIILFLRDEVCHGLLLSSKLQQQQQQQHCYLQYRCPQRHRQHQQQLVQKNPMLHGSAKITRTSTAAAVSLSSSPSSLDELTVEELRQQQHSNDDFTTLQIPDRLREKMERKGIRELLPIQVASYPRIVAGKDTVLQAPTGQGKTLAFCLPLLAKIIGSSSNWKLTKTASPQIICLCPSRELARQVGKEFERFYPSSKSSSRKPPVVTVFGGVPMERHVGMLRTNKPRILVATPGRLRELVREGYVNYQQCTTLVLDEADMLLNKADANQDVQAILSNLETAVEEAGDDDDAEYQLILVSATINDHVRDFTNELEISPSAFVTVSKLHRQQQQQQQQQQRQTPNKNDVEKESNVAAAKAAVTVLGQENSSSLSAPLRKRAAMAVAPAAADVSHWHMSCSYWARPQIAADLVLVLSPRLTIIFVPTKADTESVAAHLSENLAGTGTSGSNVSVRTLHGDMAQAARSRTIQQIREQQQQNAAGTTASGRTQQQVLVATDVASRGLDLPNVDLVIQFGIPRIAGKEGTYSTELYTHRTGRAGRIVNSRSNSNNNGQSSAALGTPDPINNKNNNIDDGTKVANAILLFDPSAGEGRLIPQLVEEVETHLGVPIRPKRIPSVVEIVEAGYQRATHALARHEKFDKDNRGGTSNDKSRSSDLALFFRSKLESSSSFLDTTDHESVLVALSKAMAALSNLDASVVPNQAHASLLSGDPSLRTVRLSKTRTILGDGSSAPAAATQQHNIALTPPEVTSFCKGLGSGKLGRVAICENNNGSSAVFDVPVKRVHKLLEKVNAAATEPTNDGDDGNSIISWKMELLLTLD